MYRPIVSSVIADIVDSGDRPRAYALHYWAINMGAAIAPPLGAFIAALAATPCSSPPTGTTTALYGVLVGWRFPKRGPRPSMPPHRPALSCVIGSS